MPRVLVTAARGTPPKRKFTVLPASMVLGTAVRSRRAAVAMNRALTSVFTLGASMPARRWVTVMVPELQLE